MTAAHVAQPRRRGKCSQVRGSWLARNTEVFMQAASAGTIFVGEVGKQHKSDDAG
jgi:hypothetical protein